MPSSISEHRVQGREKRIGVACLYEVKFQHPHFPEGPEFEQTDTSNARQLRFRFRLGLLGKEPHKLAAPKLYMGHCKALPKVQPSTYCSPYITHYSSCDVLFHYPHITLYIPINPHIIPIFPTVASTGEGDRELQGFRVMRDLSTYWDNGK